LNGLFAVLRPLPILASFSLYNSLYPGRPRLPYGENPQDSYNLSLYSLPAMFASHQISQPKTADEFRVILLGDSGIWGWFLENEDTLAAQLNEMGLVTEDGRRVTIYNLGYPIMSLSKDLLLLDAAMQYDPDLILWPVTLESFVPQKQLEHPILQNNPEPMRRLIETYNLAQDPHDPRFVDPTLWQSTLIGQRRSVADWLRLQQVGVVWSATGIDQAIPNDIPRRKSDFEADESWQAYETAVPLTPADLTFDILAAGIERAGDTPVLLLNEPIFVSDGRNSHIRYNAWYPRWAYDQYRTLLNEEAAVHNWPLIDLWDAIPPHEFTDSPVHLTPTGSRLLAERLAAVISNQ